MFSHLPDVVQLKIIKYCTFQDLKHLRRTDSHHSQILTLKQHLQRHIIIPKEQFKNTGENDKVKERLEKLQFTKALQIQTAVYSMPHSLCNAVRGLHNLRELRLTGCLKVDDDVISILSGGLLRLQVLMLSYTKVTSLGCKFICGLNLLEKLTLSCCNGVDDRAVDQITAMVSLRTLDVTHCRYITDTGFRNIEKLINLEELVVRGCEITSEAFQHISLLENLVKLDASHTNIDDAAIVHIKRLGKLKKLNIEICPLLTDRCIENLSAIRSLESLYVYGCQNISETQRLSHIAEVKSDQLILSSHMFRVYYSTRKRFFVEIK